MCSSASASLQQKISMIPHVESISQSSSTERLIVTGDSSRCRSSVLSSGAAGELERMPVSLKTGCEDAVVLIPGRVPVLQSNPVSALR